jgi:hypothetical protein
LVRLSFIDVAPKRRRESETRFSAVSIGFQNIGAVSLHILLMY